MIVEMRFLKDFSGAKLIVFSVGLRHLSFSSQDKISYLMIL